MASFHRKDSFLKRAGLFNNFLDLNKLPKVPVTVADKTYVIEAKYNERPDLLAYDLYGSSRTWWIVVLRNVDVLVDPIRDFKAGTVIKLPSKDTVENLTA